jgi:hypothetical protein
MFQERLGTFPAEIRIVPAPTGMIPVEIRMLQIPIHALQRPIAALREGIETGRSGFGRRASRLRTSPAASGAVPIPFASNAIEMGDSRIGRDVLQESSGVEQRTSG